MYGILKIRRNPFNFLDRSKFDFLISIKKKNTDAVDERVSDYFSAQLFWRSTSRFRSPCVHVQYSYITRRAVRSVFHFHTFSRSRKKIVGVFFCFLFLYKYVVFQIYVFHAFINVLYTRASYIRTYIYICVCVCVSTCVDLTRAF